MSHPDLFVGIDVAKDELVVHLHPAGTLWRVANDKAGLAALGRKLMRIADTGYLAVGFEASGGYERKLAILLERLTLTSFLLDPARVRSFARAERQLAKTDPLDAAVIARCLAALHTELTPYVHDAQAIRLAEHVRLRDLAVAQAVQLENIADPAMRRLVVAQIARLKSLVLRIEKAIATVIATSPDLAARNALLRTAPGVGPVVAACLLTRMPELGRLSRSQRWPVWPPLILKAATPAGRGDAQVADRASGASSIWPRSPSRAPAKGSSPQRPAACVMPANPSSSPSSPPCESSSSSSTPCIIPPEHSCSGQVSG